MRWDLSSDSFVGEECWWVAKDVNYYSLLIVKPTGKPYRLERRRSSNGDSKDFDKWDIASGDFDTLEAAKAAYILMGDV